MTRLPLPCALAITLPVLLPVGCVYDYPRAIQDGEVTLTIVDAEGDPAKAAHASVPGTDRLGEAAGDGKLTLLGMPVARSVIHVTFDDDKDGVPDQAAFVPFETTLARVPKNLGDGVFSQPPEVVTGLLLGEVKLSRARSISGTVTENGAALVAGRIAQVFVVRTVSLPGEDSFDVALPIEASALAAADGTFTIDGVVAGGVVRVAALLRDDGADPDAFAVADAGDLGGDVTGLALDATSDTAGTTPLQLTLFGGKERSTVDTVLFFRPGTTTALGDVVLGETAGSHVVDAPQGVFDLQVQTEDGTIGFAHGVLALGDTFSLLVPVELPTLLEPCGSADKRDCDKDGVKAIDPSDAAALDACVTACGGKRGADLDAAKCDGRDCDDDADGVADVDERACIGPLVGVDLDGDDLCEPAADLFPSCAANDATCVE